MAAKKQRRAAKYRWATLAKDAQQPEVLTTRIALEVSAGTANYYVNCIEIGHTAHDFNVTCGRVSGKPSMGDLSVARETGELHIDASVQITFSASVLPGLIEALTQRRAIYEQQFGPIKIPSEPNVTAESKH